MNEYKFKINGQEFNVSIDNIEEKEARVSVNGVSYQVELEKEDTENAVRTEVAQQCSRNVMPADVKENLANPGTEGRTIDSPLPGVIIAINVKVGDQVKAGQEIAVLEAMKMENSIESNYAGTVAAIHVSNGDSIPEGAAIISLI